MIQESSLLYQVAHQIIESIVLRFYIYIALKISIMASLQPVSSEEGFIASGLEIIRKSNG